MRSTSPQQHGSANSPCGTPDNAIFHRPSREPLFFTPVSDARLLGTPQATLLAPRECIAPFWLWPSGLDPTRSARLRFSSATPSSPLHFPISVPRAVPRVRHDHFVCSLCPRTLAASFAVEHHCVRTGHRVPTRVAVVFRQCLASAVMAVRST